MAVLFYRRTKRPISIWRNRVQDQGWTKYLPATPTISTSPTLYVGIYGADNATAPSTGYQTGAIGYAVNGVAIFGNSDADGNNAWLYEGSSFDNCGGHPEGDGEVRCFPAREG